MLLLYLGLAALGTAIVWGASGQLDTATKRLATHYRLPPLVRGAVLAAVGSSFPELTTTVVSTLVHGAFELGVAAIVGSAIFNVLVIPGVSGLASGRLDSDRLLVYKDAQFYITSVAVLLLVFSFALIYHPVESAAGGQVGEMTRLLAAIPLLVYGLYLFLHQQDTAEHQRDAAEHQRDAATAEEASPGGSVGREWLRLAASLVLIVGGVEALVRAALGLGELVGTPSFLWGLTVVAAGTSLPDLFVSLRAARSGDGVVSLGNVLGSNIFDLLVAIPAGVLVAGATPIDFGVAAPMMGFLTFATVILFAMLRTRLALSRTECLILLGLYVIFVGWMVLETTGALSVILPSGAAHP